MGFFKPADDAEGSEDAPLAGDEGPPEEADEVGVVLEAGEGGGDLDDGGGPTDG